MAKRSSVVVTSNGDHQLSPQIAEGQYFLAMSGNFDGATVDFFLDVSPASEAPTGVSYTAPNSDLVWLPRSQGYVRVTGAGPNTEIGVSVSELSSQHHRFN